MNIILKSETCNKMIKIGTKRIPKIVGLPMIENTVTNNIVGYVWFICVEKSLIRDTMPVYEFHHFKLKP